MQIDDFREGDIIRYQWSVHGSTGYDIFMILETQDSGQTLYSNEKYMSILVRDLDRKQLFNWIIWGNEVEFYQLISRLPDGEGSDETEAAPC